MSSTSVADAQEATSREDLAPRLSITLMGRFEVVSDGKPVDSAAWQYRAAARSLLKLLALEEGHRLHREQILDRLWPDSETQTADGALRKALHALRRALEPDLAPRQPSSFLITSGPLLELSIVNTAIDVDEFDRLAAIARHTDEEEALEAAVSAYGGDLLLEDLYEDWAEAKRAELKTTYRELLFRLAAKLEERGSLNAAMTPLRQALGQDPADEEIHRRLMVLLSRAGNHHAALRQYAECVRALDEELGVEPDQATDELHQQLREHISAESIGQGDLDTPVLPSRLSIRPPGPFVGRHEVLEHLQRRTREAMAGHGGSVLIGGEAGAGKTRLAIELARSAFTLGFHVLWGSAYQEDRLVPYAAFVEAIGALVATTTSETRVNLAAEYPDLHRLVGWSGTAAPVDDASLPSEGGDRARLQRDMVNFLQSISRDRPLLLVLDDVHAFDPSGVRLLEYLCSVAAQNRWLILLTYREDQLSSNPDFAQFAASSTREGIAQRIDLRGLSRAESDELAGSLARSASAGEPEDFPPQPGQLFDQTLGNPLFITELVYGGATNSSPRQPGEGAVSVPAGLYALVSSRTNGLSDETKRVLSLVSANGVHSSFGHLATAARTAFDPPMSEPTLIDALDEALEARLLEERETGNSWGYAFRHPLIQATLYDALSRQRRTHFHRHLGLALESTNSHEVEALAYHFALADNSEKAITYIEAAADRAVSLYANETAETYLRDLVVRLDDSHGVSRAAHTRIELGSILARMANYDDAIAVLEEADASCVAQGDLAGAAKAVARLAQIIGERGKPLDAIQRAERVTPTIQSLDDPTVQSEFYFTMARLHFLCGQYPESMTSSEQMLEAAERVPDATLRTRYLGQAYSCLGTTYLMIGEFEKGSEGLTESIRLAEESGDLETLGKSVSNLGAAYADAGQFAEAQARLQHALEITQRVGDPTKVAWQMCVLANTENMLGNWSECRGLLSEGLDILGHVGDSWFIPYPLVQLSALEIQEGNFDAARELLRRAQPHMDETGDLQIIRWAAGRWAEIENEEGEFEKSRDRIQKLFDEAGPNDTELNHLIPILARAYISLDIDEALRLSVEGIERSESQNDKVALVDALWIGGRAAAAAGDVKTAEKRLSEALNLARSMRYLMAEGVALLELAHVHAGHPKGKRGAMPDKSMTASEAESALEIFERLGAKREARRAKTFIAALPAAT